MNIKTLPIGNQIKTLGLPFGGRAIFPHFLSGKVNGSPFNFKGEMNMSKPKNMLTEESDSDVLNRIQKYLTDLGFKYQCSDKELRVIKNHLEREVANGK